MIDYLFPFIIEIVMFVLIARVYFKVTKIEYKLYKILSLIGWCRSITIIDSLKRSKLITKSDEISKK